MPGATTKSFLGKNYEKAAAEAIYKVKQDLATKDIEQRLKQELKRQRRKETFSPAALEPGRGDNLKVRSNCNTLKKETGKPFGITKIGARIMSIITIGGHEITRKLSEPNDQTLVQIDLYADYLRTISPQTLLRAIRALLRRGGGKSREGVDSRYTVANGPHEVMLNVNGIKMYTKTMITCDVAGQI